MSELQEKERLRRFWLAAILIFCMGAAIYAFTMVCKLSAWSWSAEQQPFLNGAAEIFCLFVLLACAVCLPKHAYARTIFASLVVLVFSFLHAMLFVVLAMLFYAGMILMTGYLLCKLFCYCTFSCTAVSDKPYHLTLINLK